MSPCRPSWTPWPGFPKSSSSRCSEPGASSVVALRSTGKGVALMAEDPRGGFARDEVEQAFAHWWKVGCVDEDWGAWVALFVPDVLYHDHFWGPLHGRDEVALW